MRYSLLRLALFVGSALCAGCGPTSTTSTQPDSAAKSAQTSSSSNQKDAEAKILELEKLNTSHDEVDQAAWLAMTHLVVEYMTKPDELSSALLDYLGLHDISRRRRAFNNLFDLHLDPVVRDPKPETLFKVYKYYDDKSYSWENQVFLSLFHNLPRDPKTLQTTFDRYKNLLFSEFDEFSYKRSMAESYAVALLVSHKLIAADNNYAETIKAIDQEVQKICPELTCGYRADLEALKRYETRFGGLPEDLKLLSIYTEDNHRDEMKYWIYSFWVRRLKEGNFSEVAAILQEIHRRYNGTPIN